MIERAYAKINLALDVKGVREDGYHELEMVNLPLNFYDELHIQKSAQMSYHCNRPYIFFDEKNTIVKALKVMRESFQLEDNFTIDLKKHIPTRAGLAGGSADAAALMRVLRNMYSLQASEQEWIALALKVGADVPFCLYNRPAIVKGIGEELTFFQPKHNYQFLLVKSRKGVSTKEAFDLLDMQKCEHTDIQRLSEALIAGYDEEAFSLMKNSLEYSSFLLEPSISRVKNGMLKEGYYPVMMSGSGSTVFTISQDEKIQKTAQKYRKRGYFVRICTNYGNLSDNNFR